MTEFDKKREERRRWLAEIASVEAGNEPTVTHRELGELVDDRDEYLAALKRWVVGNEEYLVANGEPLEV